MSNALAIAATTATLRNLLQFQMPQRDADLADLEVTTQPPDLARKNVTKAQLNLFLYQTIFNSAWRNLDMPRQVKPGENGTQPLALNLHYLITAYGRGEADNEAVSHRVLGSAMSVLHDHPVLGRQEIRLALPNADLSEQFERLRITPSPLPLEEMSKLWTAIQTQYRLSVGYEVTVLLIDSINPPRSAPPVLRRGDADRGPAVRAAASPLLRELHPPRFQQAIRLGEDLAIAGDRLTVNDALARFTSLRLEQPLQLKPVPGAQPGEIAVHLPSKAEDVSALAHWVPGFYTVSLVVTPAGSQPIASNELAIALAPQITATPLHAPAGTLNLTITCEPRIAKGQRVLLLFGDQQFAPKSIETPADTTQPSTVKFTFDVTVGTFLVRLRVDGADSIPVVYAGTPPVPSFDPAQQVSVP